MRAAALALAFVVFRAPCAETSPGVEEILRRLAATAESPRIVEERNSFGFQRRSTVDYLDEDGKVKKQVVRLFQVVPENGRLTARLVSINGRPASRGEDEPRSSARQAGERSRIPALSDALLSRFRFTFQGEETLGNRKAWVLDFQPNPDVRSEGFFDRLINAMSGTIWIDQEEFQLCKADIRLSRTISFLGGIGGSIERMNLTLVQRRIAPDLWLGESASIDFDGRKLFSRVRFRCLETCSNFQKMTSPGTVQSSLSRLE